MNLRWTCCLLVLLAAGCPDPGPGSSTSLPPDLAQQQAAPGGALALTDLSGVYQPPADAAAPPPSSQPLIQVDVEVQESGASRVVQEVESSSWRGFLLPLVEPQTPNVVCSLNDLRIKVLLFDANGRPTRGDDPSAQAVVKVGDNVLSDWDQLRALLEGVVPRLGQGELVVDGRRDAPARFVLAPFALALTTGAPVLFATPELEAEDTRDSALLAELQGAIATAPRDPDGLPRAGVRLRVDGRAPWRSVQAVLEAVTTLRIQRVTFAVVVDGHVVDLQPVRRDEAGRVVAAQPQPPPARRAKPIIVLEEEADAPGE